MNKNSLAIGLFGTCGNSAWREKFIKKYDELGIKYFNPQVKDWKPEFAKNEAEHLANDKIILFPVTSETYGLGSLSEVGFSILNAINLNNQRYFIILIDDKLDRTLTDKNLVKESLRARTLVKQHLPKLTLYNVYIVDSLNEMLRMSIILYKSELIKMTNIIRKNIK